MAPRSTEVTIRRLDNSRQSRLRMEAKQRWATTPRLRYPATTQSGSMQATVARYLRGLPLGRQRRRPGLVDERWEWWRFTKESYLTAFADLPLPAPTRVLDVGCGDGFLTCFYASMYPQAKVIGIDLNACELADAQDLAKSLRLTNVTFIAGDLLHVDEPSVGHFDMILARCVLLHLFPVPHRAWPGEPVHLLQHPEAVAIATAIHRLLVPDHGRFISTEGWTYPAQLWSWVALLTAVGFELARDASRVVRLVGPGYRAVYPMLVARAHAGTVPMTFGEVLALLAGGDLEAEEQPVTLHGYAAQALFETLMNRRLVYGFEVRCRDGSAWRRELWSAGALLLSYDYMNTDERQLAFWPQRAQAVLEAQLQGEADEFAAHQWEVVVYREPLEREGTTAPEPQT